MRGEDETTIATARRVLPTSGETRPCLLVTSGKSLGRCHWIRKHRTLLGRGDDADIRLFDDGVSRQHARIVTLPNRILLLKDLASTNGTLVNGKRVKSQALCPGDTVRIGSAAVMRFGMEDAVHAELHEHLFSAANRDPLTQLHNKRFFEEALSTTLHLRKRSKVPVSLIMFDIDHFKAVNDTHGHLAGDQVLKEVAEVVRSVLGPEDQAARIGGEEFAVIASGRCELEATQLAETLRAAIEARRVSIDLEVLNVTSSFGVQGYERSRHDEPKSLIAEADARLYIAKRSGRNRVEAGRLAN